MPQVRFLANQLRASTASTFAEQEKNCRERCSISCALALKGKVCGYPVQSQERRQVEIETLGKGAVIPADPPLAMGECLAGVPCLLQLDL